MLKPAELLGDLSNRRALEAGAVGELADRQAPVVQSGDAGIALRLIVAAQFDPLEGHAAAVQEIPDRMRLGRPARSEEPDPVFVHEVFLDLPSSFDRGRRLACRRPWRAGQETSRRREPRAFDARQGGRPAVRPLCPTFDGADARD
jgi:hypothetical protein